MIVRFKNRQQASKFHIDVMECDGSFRRWEKYLIQSTLQDNQLNIIIERVKSQTTFNFSSYAWELQGRIPMLDNKEECNQGSIYELASWPALHIIQ